jgi:hypothetical protein
MLLHHAPAWLGRLASIPILAWMALAGASVAGAGSATPPVVLRVYSDYV